jgi:hypothetical protein
MSFIVTMGNSSPATTEAVFGTTDFKSFYLDLDQATADQQKICADFLALVGGHASVNIINSDHNFDDCSYVVVSGVDTDIVEVDYDSLTTTKKGKINNFANLLKSLAQ